MPDPLPANPPTALTPRDREILKDVVHTYILSGAPVSSRTVAKHSQHGVSAATVRNVMADLEELGLLEQPHSSAGRVPSRAGYHLYIETLMDSEGPAAAERRLIEERLAGAPTDPGALIDDAPQLLSQLTHQVGVVVMPEFGETVLEAVDLVPLSGRRVLCVVVSSTGFVESKLIEADEEIPRTELVRIANYLTENFRGMTLRVIRDRLLALLQEERAQVDRLLARAIALASRGLGALAPAEVRIEGTSTLLSHPELSDLDRVRRLLETFANREKLVRLLGRCTEGSGVRVWIGDDNEETSGLGVSIVARPFGAGPGKERGAIGIFGPSRMAYHRIIPLVDYLGESLSRALEASAAR